MTLNNKLGSVLASVKFSSIFFKINIYKQEIIISTEYASTNNNNEFRQNPFNAHANVRSSSVCLTHMSSTYIMKTPAFWVFEPSP
jgi:hypothetical protein